MAKSFPAKHLFEVPVNTDKKVNRKLMVTFTFEEVVQALSVEFAEHFSDNTIVDCSIRISDGRCLVVDYEVES